MILAQLPMYFFSHLVILVFCLVVTQPAHARRWTERQLRDQSLHSLRALKTLGLDRIGSKSVLELEHKFSKTSWKISHQFIMASGGERKGGAYLAEDGMIMVNRHTLEKSSGAGLRAFLLHEALGASGIDDDDYRVSVSALILIESLQVSKSLPVREYLFRNLRNAIEFDKNREYLLAGGGTSVGGGGDSVTTEIFLGLAQKLSASDTRALAKLGRIFSLNVRVDYSPESLAQTTARIEGKRVEVSYIRWTMLSDYRALVLNQIWSKLP